MQDVGANAKAQRRNELGDTIVNAKKELTSIPLNSLGTVVEYLICSSFPGSKIKSGMTKMVSPSSRSPIWPRASSAGMTKEMEWKFVENGL